ncbi:hypothetical protein GBA52_012166, partial [Prunus armeniaca]
VDKSCVYEIRRPRGGADNGISVPGIKKYHGTQPQCKPSSWRYQNDSMSAGSGAKNGLGGSVQEGTCNQMGHLFSSKVLSVCSSVQCSSTADRTR